jgi:nucleolar protein 58
MLVLFETPAGYALFKVLDEGKIEKTGDIVKAFSDPETASEVYLPRIVILISP